MQLSEGNNDNDGRNDNDADLQYHRNSPALTPLIILSYSPHIMNAQQPGACVLVMQRVEYTVTFHHPRREGATKGNQQVAQFQCWQSGSKVGFAHGLEGGHQGYSLGHITILINTQPLTHLQWSSGEGIRPSLPVCIPTTLEVVSGEIPKSLSRRLSQSSGVVPRTGELSVLPLPTNPYLGTGGLNWLVYYLPPEPSGLTDLVCLDSRRESAWVEAASFFHNRQQLLPYFTIKEGLTTNSTPAQYVIVGFYHVCQDNKWGIIDFLCMHSYECIGGEWVTGKHTFLPAPPNSPHVGQSNIWNVHNQRWQSMMDLQTRLKALIHSLTYNYYIAGHHQHNRCHYCIAFSLGDGRVHTILVYNHETLLENAMLSGRGNSRSIVEQQYRWLAKYSRLRYPWPYYRSLMLQVDQAFQFLGTRSVMPSNMLALAKYSLIQHVGSVGECTAVDTSTIPYRHLSADPVSGVFMVYWPVSPPGSHKTQLLASIMACLQDYHAQVTPISCSHICQIHDTVAQFCRSQSIFSQERFAYILLDTWFSTQKLLALVELLGRLVPRHASFQICLVTSPPRQATVFLSEIIHSKAQGKSQKPNEEEQLPLASTIQTTYGFSIDFILCCLLGVQSRCPNPSDPYSMHGESTKSAAHFLHYLSSAYTNLDLHKVAYSLHTPGGSIRVIEYSAQDRFRINWPEEGDGLRNQIVDQARILLEMSYKAIIQEDVLLAYFLENIGELDLEISLEGWGQAVVDATFPNIPYPQNT